VEECEYQEGCDEQATHSERGEDGREHLVCDLHEGCYSENHTHEEEFLDEGQARGDRG
jgi:hypothetical protein